MRIEPFAAGNLAGPKLELLESERLDGRWASLGIADGNGHFLSYFVGQFFNLLELVKLSGCERRGVGGGYFSMQFIGQAEEFGGVRDHGQMARSVAHLQEFLVFSAGGVVQGHGSVVGFGIGRAVADGNVVLGNDLRAAGRGEQERESQPAQGLAIDPAMDGSVRSRAGGRQQVNTLWIPALR